MTEEGEGDRKIETNFLSTEEWMEVAKKKKRPNPVDEIFLEMIRKYSEEKDFNEHVVFVPPDLVFFIWFKGRWRYRVYKAEIWKKEVMSRCGNVPTVER